MVKGVIELRMTRVDGEGGRVEVLDEICVACGKTTQDIMGTLVVTLLIIRFYKI